MAQSPIETNRFERPENSPYLKAWTAINELLREGQSWSGNERKVCYLNTRAPRFADISAIARFDFPDDGRGMCLVDWDLDGDLDVWHACRTSPAVRFLRNELGGNHFLALRLEGKLCNRDAIGARVELHREGQPVLIKTLRAGEGYLSQSSKWIHLGLGDSTTIDRLVIRWPGGEPQEVTGLAADQFYSLIQGEAPQAWVSPGADSNRSNDDPTPTATTASDELARAVLTPPRPSPQLAYLDAQGRPVPLANRAGKVQLVNVWATWCKPCVAELTEFARRADELREAGVEVVAINVDAIAQGEDADRSAATNLLGRIQFPFAAGFATPELASAFQNGPALFLDRAGQLPLPSSFLFDGRDRMAVIYSGPVTVDQLLNDARLAKAGAADLARTALPFPGIWARVAIPPINESTPAAIAAQSGSKPRPSEVKKTAEEDDWFYYLGAAACFGVAAFFVMLLLRPRA